jgi:putative ABC transport system ATP-binding protein
MIRLTDLRFQYGDGDFALRVPELAVESGQHVAVIGPSGSGKTTLLHVIAGIGLPQTGSVEIDGANWTEMSEADRRALRVQRIGLVFQEFELLEHLRVLDNITLPYRIHPSLSLGSECRDRAKSLAGKLGIDDKLARFPAHLSHGEKQRVAVCRALVTEPDLILADEPTGNLDPANKRRVLDYLIDGVSERGATLVLVTHDHDLLDRFDRIIDVKSLSEGAGS